MGIAANRQQLISVRHAEDRDLPALLELLNLYFAEGEVQDTETESSVLAQMRAPLLGFYVAETQGVLAGCVLCRALEGLESAVECKRLYVRPEYRGCGIATRPMSTIEAEARATGVMWMYLDSNDGFTAAMAMYARQGYVECPRYNDNPEAAYFFRKRLG